MALLGSRSLADVIMLEGLTWSRAGLRSNPRSPRQKRTQRHTGRQRRRGYRPGASPAKVQDAEEEEGRLEMLLPQTPRGGLVSRPLTVDLGEAHFCCDSRQLGSSDRTVATPRSTCTRLGSESRTPRSAHSPPGDAARFRDPGELAVCSPTSIRVLFPGAASGSAPQHWEAGPPRWLGRSPPGRGQQFAARRVTSGPTAEGGFGSRQSSLRLQGGLGRRVHYQGRASGHAPGWGRRSAVPTSVPGDATLC